MRKLSTEEELLKLAEYSLEERALHYQQLLGIKVTPRRMSSIYKSMGIKKRKLRKFVPKNHQETPLRLLRLEKLRDKVITLMRGGHLLIFVDECTFSPKSYASTVWQMPG